MSFACRMLMGSGPKLDTTGTAADNGASLIGYGIASFGTMVNNVTSDGLTVYAAYDEGGSFFKLIVNGFGADPGQGGWATSAVVDGGTPFLLASADSYSYGGGQATWTWNSVAGFVDTVGYTLVIQ